jgi:tetratricopeptide (TPR) repeat protein
MCAYPRSTTLALSFLLLCSQAATAQSKPAQDKTLASFAAESYVIGQNDGVYSNNADGTGYREHTVAVTVQSDAALRAFGVVAVPFASATEHVDFHYARVRHKDGSVTETPTKDAMEQPEQVTREAPFYSDLKEEQLPIKNLQVGDTLEWQARIVRTRAEAPGYFWGQESFVDESGVALEESIELRVPVASAATVWTNPQLGVKPVETTEGDTKIYVWKTAQLAPTAGPVADAAKKAKKERTLTPEEELDAEEGKLPSVAWSSFKDWDAVGVWYRKLQANRTVPDDEIKAKVAELIAGKTTEEEKVRALYAYVSTQIRYIGVAFGIGRFQPHEAVDVLHNQYGDCKDKTTLLAAMLNAAGISSDATLIGSEIRFNEAVPSPGAFNHLITHLMVDGKDVWLDSTEEIAPYRMMVITLRGKKALVVPPQDVAKIETTPADPPFTPEETWTAKGTLDKQGVSESHIVVKTRGDSELLIRALLRQVSPAQYDEFMQRLANSEGYAGTTSHASFTRPDDTAGPMVMEFDYHRERAGDWDNLRIVPQIEPLNLPVLDDKDPPAAPIDLGAPHTQTSHAEMKLPAGWSAELPEAEHRKNAYVSYDETYKLENGTVIADSKLVVLQRRIPASDWKIFTKFINDVKVEQYISLRRGYGTTDTIVPVTLENAESKGSDADDTNLSAEMLINKAYAAIQKLDPEKAKALLKRAEAKDAKAPRLWSAYADLAAALGVMSEAEEDTKKEIALHPRETESYKVMFRIEQMRHDTAAMGPTLQKWTELEPDNQEAQSTLARVMLNDKKYPEAAAAASKALELMGPEEAEKNESLRLVLGKAQLHAGMLEKGDTTLTAILKTTDNPGFMNDAAYELADAKLELPLDDVKVREALERMTSQSRTWTGDENESTLRRQSNLLMATWDTMGWILFREGKVNEAKSYIDAAVLLRPDAEVKKHAAAIKVAMGVREPMPAKPVRKPDVTVTGTTIGRELVTIPLGAAGDRTGFGQYKMLLSRNGVERVDVIDNRTIDGMETILKHLDVAKYFPEESDAKLAWRGFVNCMGDKCMLNLEP